MKWIRATWPLVLLLAGCSFSGGGAGGKESAHVIVTLLRFQAAADSTAALTTLRVDLATDSDNEEVIVVLQSSRKNPTITLATPTSLDTVTLTRYTISYARADGGPVPGPYTVATSITIPAPPADPAAPLTSVTAPVLVFRASDKLVSPFSTLRRPGELFLTATVTLTGFDLRGDEVNATGSLLINFFRSA